MEDQDDKCERQENRVILATLTLVLLLKSSYKSIRGLCVDAARLEYLRRVSYYNSKATYKKYGMPIGAFSKLINTLLFFFLTSLFMILSYLLLKLVIILVTLFRGFLDIIALMINLMSSLITIPFLE